MTVLSSLSALSGFPALFAAEDLSVFSPVSPPAETIRDLFWLVLGITGGIFVVVESVLLYCIVRFRRRPGESPTHTEPPQIYGSHPIEVAWTVAPALIVFVLFMIVLRCIWDIRHDREPPAGALEITVVGHQWWWEFRYYKPVQPDGKPGDYLFTTANEMHVPVGEPVYLRLESADVVHSFWVPRLAGKTDVIPRLDKPNRMWFQAQAEGVYLGQCAEFCGTQHANMMFRVVVRSPEQYEKWLAEQQRPAAEDSAGQAGREFFMNNTCVNCHTVRYNGSPANGTFGPDLTHLMSRKKLAAEVIDNDTEGLTAWLKDPQKVKPGCLMPNFNLAPEDLQQLVAFLKTLK